MCLNGIKRSIKLRKMRMQKSSFKIMLIEIFDAEDIIHHEFVAENQTVIGKFFFKSVFK
jgi:hypothetical protein